MALQWNALEADRVGLPEDARTFRARMGTYQEQVNAIRKKRATAEQYWQDLEKKYLALKDGTQKKIADLKMCIRDRSWMAREKSSSPSAFFGGAVRMHTFPRSLQKGAVMTRSPGLILSLIHI